MEEQVYVVKEKTLMFPNPPGIEFKTPHMPDWAAAMSQPAKGSTLTVYQGDLLRATTAPAQTVLADLAKAEKIAAQGAPSTSA